MSGAFVSIPCDQAYEVCILLVVDRVWCNADASWVWTRGFQVATGRTSLRGARIRAPLTLQSLDTGT